MRQFPIDTQGVGILPVPSYIFYFGTKSSKLYGYSNICVLPATICHGLSLKLFFSTLCDITTVNDHLLYYCRCSVQCSVFRVRSNGCDVSKPISKPMSSYPDVSYISYIYYYVTVADGSTALTWPALWRTTVYVITLIVTKLDKSTISHIELTFLETVYTLKTVKRCVLPVASLPAFSVRVYTYIKGNWILTVVSGAVTVTAETCLMWIQRAGCCLAEWWRLLGGDFSSAQRGDTRSRCLQRWRLAQQCSSVPSVTNVHGTSPPP